MERERFDRLTRLVAATSSRRAAIGSILGLLVLGQDAAANGGKHHHHSKGKRPSGRVRVCYPGDKCVPGTARTNTQCDFSHSDVFVGLDAQSSNLSGSNFTNADLRGADLRAVNLSDSCLIDATLAGATVDASTNLHRARFCNTVMPDGSIRDDDCDRPTPCCSGQGRGSPGTCPGGRCFGYSPNACGDGCICDGHTCLKCVGNDEVCQPGVIECCSPTVACLQFCTSVGCQFLCNVI